MNNIINPIRHGLIMAIIAMVSGALWAAYMATNHEQLHSSFGIQEEKVQKSQMDHLMSDLHSGAGHDHNAVEHATGNIHSHSGSLAKDAMQRLLRGHIHFMGLGVLSAVLLLVTSMTSLKKCWKKTLGWTFGLGALAYPPAWIMMGFRTVELGPQTAEASVMWLFAPAVGLLLSSMVALLTVLSIEMVHLNEQPIFRVLFESVQKTKTAK